MQIKVKDEYRSALYPLSSEEMESLRLSIEARGVDVPIVVDEDGWILDGHHRFAIAGQDCPVQIRSGLSEAEKLATIYTTNLARRNLSPEQKREIRHRMREIAVRLNEEGMSQPRIGATLGVDQSTVSDWLNISSMGSHTANIWDARTKVGPEAKQDILRRVEKGEKQEQIAADHGIKQSRVSQIVQAERKTQAIREAESKAATAEGFEPKVYHMGAAAFLHEVVTEPVDLLLTDPPYMTDVPDMQEFLDSWLSLALSKIKPAGRAYICTGSYPEEMHAYLDRLLSQKFLILEDVLVWTYRNTLGPSTNIGYKRNWQSIFHLRGTDAPALRVENLADQFAVFDIAAPDGRHPAGRLHPWQKPDELARRLIQHATMPGDLVLDPFAGTGTFLRAATSMGRRSIGCEMDDATFAIAEQRGCARG